MHTSETKLMKREYSIPKIECVQLDNEISLALESTPPYPGNETQQLKAPDYFNNDPFKMA